MMAALRWCFSCFMSDSSAHIPLKEMPVVQLDTQNMAGQVMVVHACEPLWRQRGSVDRTKWVLHWNVRPSTLTITDGNKNFLEKTPADGCDVVVVKSGRRICGTGACLANAPLHQNKSYFEFKVQSTGVWGVGVATRKVDLSRVPLGGDTESLVLRHDGTLSHRSEECNRLPANSLPQEGDVIGITYDHVEMSVYVNGKNTHCSASGIRGTVYPVVYVDDSAILDCQFSDFYHSPPLGFEKIMFEQQIF